MTRLSLIDQITARMVSLPEPLLETLADVAQALTHQARDRSDALRRAQYDGPPPVFTCGHVVEQRDAKCYCRVCKLHLPLVFHDERDVIQAPDGAGTPSVHSERCDREDDRPTPGCPKCKEIVERFFCPNVSPTPSSDPRPPTGNAPAADDPPVKGDPSVSLLGAICGTCDTTIPDCACGRNSTERPWWKSKRPAPATDTDTCRDCGVPREAHRGCGSFREPAVRSRG